MIYHLHDLLKKMGAPALRDKRRLEWYYFDKATNQLAGFAEVRLEAGGEFLVAELKRYDESPADKKGKRQERFEDSFFLYAERTARPEHYRITRMSFDGQDYGHPTRPIVEMGLGVFHGRALDISIRMVEQAFNKTDMLDAVETPAPEKTVITAKSSRRRIEHAPLPAPVKTAQQEAYGVVVPFRPRSAMAPSLAS